MFSVTDAAEIQPLHDICLAVSSRRPANLTVVGRVVQ
jgi:hypothetical protein